VSLSKERNKGRRERKSAKEKRIFVLSSLEKKYWGIEEESF
jgi:hypothetical protein